MNKLFLICLSTLLIVGGSMSAQPKLTDYVNPFRGTTTLWETEDLGYERHREARTWGAETLPGASLPNAMVQATPVTMYHSGSGYQYEDKTIFGFAHTGKGHWNLCHVPILPVTGWVNPADYASGFSHDRESAHPGYYQVFLERYGVNVELTTTLRCAFHRYSYRPEDDKKVLVDITRSNNNIREWSIERAGTNVFCGSQWGDGKIYFYAVTNYEIDGLTQYQGGRGNSNAAPVSVITFRDSKGEKPLEMKIGFSFVSVENAKMNLEAEMLRSDVNGDYTDVLGNVVNNGFRYYTDPSFWDDHRNKVILMGLISPDVAVDVIKSITDKDTTDLPYYREFKAGVQKTLEYSYDDYATAQIAKVLGDRDSYELLMKRSQNYRNVWDPSTGFYRGRIDDGSWYADFDPYYPYHCRRKETQWLVPAGCRHEGRKGIGHLREIVATAYAET